MHYPYRLLARFSIIAALAGTLAACGGARTIGSAEPGDGPPRSAPRDIASIPDAVPRQESLSPYGNPDSYEVLGRRYQVLASAKDFRERGTASWYGRKFHGRRTSSGEPYDMYRMTAAHKTLPLPSYARVTNLENGRSVVVRINDRGPFHGDRVIDMSYVAAVRLDMIGNGTAPVSVETLSAGDKPPEVAAADPTLYLQVGAYKEAKNARSMARKVESLGLRRVFLSPTLDDQPLYRVRVGPFADVDALNSAREDLEANGLKVSTLRD